MQILGHLLFCLSVCSFACTPHSFACTPHSFACSALLNLFAGSTALIHSLAYSLISSLEGRLLVRSHVNLHRSLIHLLLTNCITLTLCCAYSFAHSVIPDWILGRKAFLNHSVVNEKEETEGERKRKKERERRRDRERERKEKEGVKNGLASPHMNGASG